MNYNIRDLVLALISAFLGSVKGLLVSKLKTLGPSEIFGFRSLGSICFIIPILIFYNYKLWYDYKNNLVLLLRSLVGNVAVCGYYFGFAYLPIAEASLLFYSTPVFSIIIGSIFLKEKFGASEVISTIFSLLGIALVSVPDFTFNGPKDTTNAIKGVAGSITGAIAQAVALAVVRKITFIPPPVVSFWWAMLGIPFSVVLTQLQSGKSYSCVCGLEAWIIVLIAVVGFVSELCLVAALKSTDAVIISIVLTSEILWAFILQISVNHDWPNFMCILGGLAIVCSISVVPMVNYMSSKKRRA